MIKQSFTPHFYEYLYKDTPCHFGMDIDDKEHPLENHNTEMQEIIQLLKKL